MSAYLSVLASMSAFVTVWAKLLKKFTQKFHFWFWCKFWQSFGPTDTKTYRHTLIPYTENLLYMYASKTGKKGNFLLFHIVIVFQIAELMFGWLVRKSKHIQGICLDGGICLDFYKLTVSGSISVTWHKLWHCPVSCHMNCVWSNQTFVES